MFDVLIVQPVFNLLVLIIALIPGHNFGLAVILFTIIIRLLLWPLIKKQLHQAKLMRKIRPELKRISQEAKGDRQKQALLQMELYKERGINPLKSIGVVLLQLPILIGLYVGLQRVIRDPNELLNFAYEPLRDLPWMQRLADNINNFDVSLFGLVDLSQAAVSSNGLYLPALAIVTASAVVQYFQAKQLTPVDKDARSLRAILSDASGGKQADQNELNAAVGRFTVAFLPAMIFVFTAGIASALPLYMLVGGLVALVQQTIVLREDAEEMQELSEPSKSTKTIRSNKIAASKITTKQADEIPEAEVVGSTEKPLTDQKLRKKKSGKSKKRRRR